MSAKNTIFNVIKFTFMLNLAIGFLFTVYPAMGNLGVGVSYSPNATYAFTSEMETQINPDGLLEDKTDATSRVFDMINLGMISKVGRAFKNYLYGIIVLCDSIFGGFMDQAVRNFLFYPGIGIAYIMMTVGYIFAVWSLWTGQDE